MKLQTTQSKCFILILISGLSCYFDTLIETFVFLWTALQCNSEVILLNVVFYSFKGSLYVHSLLSGESQKELQGKNNIYHSYFITLPVVSN